MQSNYLPGKKKAPVGSVPGSALVITLITMGMVLAYSVHALQSSSAMHNFAQSRALRINQYHYLALAYTYGQAFCTQHHKQLCQSNDSVHIVITADQDTHNYAVDLVIVPLDTHYILMASINKGSAKVVSGQKIIFYDSISC